MSEPYIKTTSLRGIIEAILILHYHNSKGQEVELTKPKYSMDLCCAIVAFKRDDSHHLG